MDTNQAGTILAAILGGVAAIITAFKANNRAASIKAANGNGSAETPPHTDALGEVERALQATAALLRQEQAVADRERAARRKLEDELSALKRITNETETGLAQQTAVLQRVAQNEYEDLEGK